MGGHQKYKLIAEQMMGRASAPAPRQRHERRPAPPIPTIMEVMRDGGWFWAHCSGGAATGYCSHNRALTFAQFAILWGLDASTDLIRERLVCGRCGRRGAMLTLPSRDGLGQIGPFPAS